MSDAPPQAPPTFVTVSGDPIVVDQSAEACASFGFFAGQHVRFTKSRQNGRIAKIAGVHGGSLWFECVGGDGRVQTTSCTCQAEYLRQYGWTVCDEEGVPPATQSAASVVE